MQTFVSKIHPLYPSALQLALPAQMQLCILFILQSMLLGAGILLRGKYLCLPSCGSPAQVLLWRLLHCRLRPAASALAAAAPRWRAVAGQRAVHALLPALPVVRLLTPESSGQQAAGHAALGRLAQPSQSHFEQIYSAHPTQVGLTAPGDSACRDPISRPTLSNLQYPMVSMRLSRFRAGTLTDVAAKIYNGICSNITGNMAGIAWVLLHVLQIRDDHSDVVMMSTCSSP